MILNRQNYSMKKKDCCVLPTKSERRSEQDIGLAIELIAS